MCDMREEGFCAPNPGPKGLDGVGMMVVVWREKDLVAPVPAVTRHGHGWMLFL